MKRQLAILRIRLVWLRIQRVLIVLQVPWWFLTALGKNLRCYVIGWHGAAPSWRLVYGEAWQPLYWRYGQVCSHCGMLRPGTFRYYRWHTWHGYGPEPMLTPRELDALAHDREAS